MRFYTVHTKGDVVDPDRDLTVVKEGFSWPAFFLSFLWALWHRMWSVGIGLLVVEIGLGLAADALGLAAAEQGVLTLGLALVVGFVANDLRRGWLSRHGFSLAGVTAAEGRDAALRRFLDSRPALSFAMGA
ncbi:MAG: DUF2628 domain-containing protein [Proteobacteria bacterium]|nr:DUF2628 domain-containing protein [Pseudomonadota bacterium]